MTETNDNAPYVPEEMKELEVDRIFRTPFNISGWPIHGMRSCENSPTKFCVYDSDNWPSGSTPMGENNCMVCKQTLEDGGLDLY